MADGKQDIPLVEGASQDQQGELDGFALTGIFPEAKGLISFKRTSIETSIVNGIVVLDTSALLKAYALDEAALAGVGAIYRDLIEAKRLVVPSHAVREFANRRPQKLKDLHQQVSDATRGPLRTTLAAFDRFPQHARIVELETEIAGHLAERDRLLKDMLATIEGWHGDDPVNMLYRELFADDVIVDPDLDADALRQDAEHRFKHRIPPGFKDASKKANASGDVLIWHSVLAAGRRGRDAIVVSGEQKTDWFHRSKKAPLFERVELLDEYRRASGGKSLHIITFEQFLRHFKADTEVVRQVKLDNSGRSKASSSQHWGQQAERVVQAWLETLGLEVLPTGDFPDFLVIRPTVDKLFYVEVRLASMRPLYVAKANDVLARAKREQAEPLVLVFVALTPSHAERALKMMQSFFTRKSELVTNTRIMVGVLSDDGAGFEPLGEVLGRQLLDAE